ncbi:hypothetical protein BASA81_006033 [Batrachochytrium salamandrivorans]|nr:hypothetical protein BASA81_006033 [Batrachochytrium salamandrivorans]
MNIDATMAVPVTPTIYSPREQHAVAIDSVQDILYLTFGKNWTNDHSDIWSYNFNNSMWSFLTPLDLSASKPVARHGHTSWMFNSTLMIFGGVSEFKPLNDIWSFDPGKLHALI